MGRVRDTTYLNTMSLCDRLKKRLREIVWDEPVKKRFKSNYPRPEENVKALEAFRTPEIFKQIIPYLKEPKRGDPYPDYWSEDCIVAFTLDMLKKTCWVLNQACHNYVLFNPIKIVDPRVNHEYMSTYLGSIPCLEEALKRKWFPPSPQMTCLATSMDNFRMLRFLQSIKCKWDKGVCVTAAKNGNVEILKYAIATGATFNPGLVCREAATYGRLNVLEYVVDIMKSSRFFYESLF